MEVEGAFGHVGGGEDLADGGGLVATLFEDGGCGHEDGVAGANGPVLFGLWHLRAPFVTGRVPVR